MIQNQHTDLGQNVLKTINIPAIHMKPVDVTPTPTPEKIRNQLIQKKIKRKELVERLKQYQKINEHKLKRGVIEMCYSWGPQFEKEWVVLSISTSFLMEFSAGCGGSVCSYCLKAIPNKKEMLELLKVGQPLREHFITKSTERCRCINAITGTYRENFGDHQSKFFIDTFGYAIYELLVKEMKKEQRDRNKIAQICTSIFDYIRKKQKEKECSLSNAHCFNVLAYDICMTYANQICDLCKVRRIAQKRHEKMDIYCEECVYSLNHSHAISQVNNISLIELTFLIQEQHQENISQKIFK